MADFLAELGTALDKACAAVPHRELAASVDRLISRYRDPHPASAPILASATDTIAYAAYRMPATLAAVRSVLTQLIALNPGFRPETLLDLGGGTGSAVWAAAELFPSLASVTVFDQAVEALRLGRELAEHTEAAAFRSVQWKRGAFSDLGDLGAADLVTISYVLSELTATDQANLVARSAATGSGTIAVIEPGTPDGHRRILAARGILIDAGYNIVAPCPHQYRCPLAEGTDWCHFAARVNRSPLHRRLKGGDLAYEDEKFSYIVASRSAQEPVTGRILRHPLKRKGLVTLQLCTRTDDVTQMVVSKRQGTTYRRARDIEWGELWPPHAPVVEG